MQFIRFVDWKLTNNNNYNSETPCAVTLSHIYRLPVCSATSKRCHKFLPFVGEKKKLKETFPQSINYHSLRTTMIIYYYRHIDLPRLHYYCYGILSLSAEQNVCSPMSRWTGSTRTAFAQYFINYLYFLSQHARDIFLSRPRRRRRVPGCNACVRISNIVSRATRPVDRIAPHARIHRPIYRFLISQCRRRTYRLLPSYSKLVNTYIACKRNANKNLILKRRLLYTSDKNAYFSSNDKRYSYKCIVVYTHTHFFPHRESETFAYRAKLASSCTAHDKRRGGEVERSSFVRETWDATAANIFRTTVRHIENRTTTTQWRWWQ